MLLLVECDVCPLANSPQSQQKHAYNQVSIMHLTSTQTATTQQQSIPRIYKIGERQIPDRSPTTITSAVLDMFCDVYTVTNMAVLNGVVSIL